MTDFSTREVAKALGLTLSKLRSCAHAAQLAPGRDARGRLRWSFQDLLLLRTTRGLLDAHVPARRIRRLLASLRRQLPGDQALSSVSVYADGRRVVAWDGAARWQPDSGQFLFTFDAPALAPAASAAPAEAAAPASAETTRTAEEWFDLGCELESSSPAEARHAYEQALAIDPQLADAHINLGRLFHAAGEAAPAETHYRAALRHAPDDPIAHFNLGGLLEDTGRAAAAVEAYQRAVAADPDFADAHYNLGLLLDRLGRRTAAMTHLRSARRLYARRSA
ncbi:MAG TPA: tetratricopeptide repeat protein [Methylomirabilota bacterium]|nr:tetratricopeptide repeat protein [Methylomirabilota bacterium]